MHNLIKNPTYSSRVIWNTKPISCSHFLWMSQYMSLMASLFTWQFFHMPRFFKFWGWYVCFYIYNTKKVCLCMHTIKKAESQRIDAFELWCWRRLLRIPWTVRRSNQSILKEISPECSLEGLRLKLKLQHFGHLMWRTDSFEKTLMLGKIEGGRRRGRQKMRWLDGITDSMDMNLSKFWELGDGQGGLECCSPWGHKESDSTEQQNWCIFVKWKIKVEFIVCLLA